MLSIEKGQDYENVSEADLPYELLGNLGFGHSGNVERVRDRNTDAIYARKTIRITSRRLSRQEKSKVFQNEVKIIRALECHHHIISVFATYTTESHFGLILDPVASDGDLDHYIAGYWKIVDEDIINEAGKSHPRLEAMKVILEQAFGCLASGLAFMCQKRVRHRDIKPNNILVHNGRVLYTDFGYSFDSSGFSRSTTEGRPSFLTRKYSAPEVLEYEKKSSKSDLYSLGCVFIELLFALLKRSEVEQEIDCYSSKMDEIHGWLDALDVPTQYSVLPGIIREMTSRERTERSSADRVAHDLQAVSNLFCAQCSPNNIHDVSTEMTSGAFTHYPYPNLVCNPSSDEWFLPSWGVVEQRWILWHHVAGRWVLYDKSSSVHQLAQPTGQLQRVSNGRTLINSQAAQPAMQPAQGHHSNGPTFDLPRGPSYEKLDPSFHVRSRDFFSIGKVFAILFHEQAGNALGYNDAISHVRFGDQMYAQIRRFITVRKNREFCYAIPIFTYANQGTKKRGVDPDKHTIAYSLGQMPTILDGEKNLTMSPICIAMSQGIPPLSVASRIFFGIHLPIQYNSKVKDIGSVHPDHIASLIEHWNALNDPSTQSYI